MKDIKVYKDQDVSKNHLVDKTIGIIGYGNQGRAQALNLRDSKLDVIIGLREGSLSKKKAESDNFKVYSIDELIENSDIISFLIPDEQIPSIFSNLKFKKGQAVLFSHGYSIHFNQIVPPDFVDVILVAPSGSGVMLRKEYLIDKGIPSLIAVDKDYSWNGILLFS